MHGLDALSIILQFLSSFSISFSFYFQCITQLFIHTEIVNQLVDDNYELVYYREQIDDQNVDFPIHHLNALDCRCLIMHFALDEHSSDPCYLLYTNTPIMAIPSNRIYWLSLVVQLCLLLTSCQITECATYVQNLLNDLLHFKITSIPLPSLMYSGITANNAGQLTECQLSNYSYYLAFLKNTTTMTESYYGLCMPKQCTADDIEIALQFLRAKVYDMDGLTISNELLSLVAAILVGAWIASVLLCSLWTYFRSHRINQYLNGDKQDSVTVTQASSADHPSTQTYSEPSSSHAYSEFLLIYFQGYKRIFTQPSKPSPFTSILFLAVVSFACSIEFSYRQNISQNFSTIYDTLVAPFGIFVCNVEICLHTIIFILGYKMADKLDKIRRFTKIGRIYFAEIMLKWINLILMSLLVYAFCSFMVQPPLSKIWKDNNAKDCGNYIWQTWFSLRNLQLDCKVCLPWFALMETDLLLTLLSLPLVLIFRTTKKLGYFLYLILMGVSIFISYSILKNESIVFEPYKLMNGQKQFWIDYQGNSFVRMAPYFTGFFVGLFITQAKDKTKQQTVQAMIANKLNRLKVLKWALSLVGLSLMIYCYILISPYLSVSNSQKQPADYIVLCPLAFVMALSLFTLPSLLPLPSTPCPVTKLLNACLCHPYWAHLHNISVTAYFLCPMVIAYSTYNSQNSINYSIATVLLYLLGDLFICYFVCILVTASFENQARSLVQAIKGVILGKEMRYGDILVQYL